MANDDGSEDVNDFLARIRELGDKQDREEEERTKKLEEDILKGRQERAARRAERARSISPTKGSPASTVASLSATRQALDTPSRSTDISPAKQLENAPESSPLNLEPSKPEPPANSSLSRSNTLSWQQRPSSRTSPAVRSRPLSVVASENHAFRSPSATPEPTSLQEKENTTSESVAQPSLHGDSSQLGRSSSQSSSAHPMAAMFANKDPSWFRQTEDRGKGSAAYRKSEEPESEPVSRSGSVRMPGMGSQNDTQRAPQRDGFGGPRGRHKSVIGSVAADLAAVRLDPPEDGDETAPAMSPAQGRISPERPSSPTKGLGGFVQSAMLKRSDSVSKRWSAQVPGGLSRGNSITGGRASHDLGSELTTSSAHARSPSPAKQGTPSEDRIVEAEVNPGTDTSLEIDNVRASKSPPPNSTSRPSSPTKDTRRWSPVKSSWLENAINKPDSPRPPQKPATSQQPAWMAELQKAKAARASVDVKNAPEQTPDNYSTSSSSFRGSRPISTLRGNDKPVVPTKPSLVDEAASETLKDTFGKAKTEDETADSSKPTSLEQSPAVKKQPPPATKPKPQTPPKKDFRASLKPRTVDINKGQQDEPEFKKAFGNLKRAEIKNYKAPDTLKENISRGKAALAVTGGPQKTQRVDDFKESILAKKKEFGAAPAKPPVRNPSQIAEKPVPEALARRTGMLNRTKSISEGSKPDSLEDTKASEKTTSTPKTSIQPKPVVEQTAQVKNSALAARFNPNLAGLLARGPPAASSASDTERPSAPSRASTTDAVAQKGPELTHATKGRARGPKRKPPTSASKSESSTPNKAGTPALAKSPPTSSVGTPKGEPLTTSIADKLNSYNAIKTSLLGDGSSAGLVGPSISSKPSATSKVTDKPPVSSGITNSSPNTKSKPPAPKSSSSRVSSIHKPTSTESTSTEIKAETQSVVPSMNTALESENKPFTPVKKPFISAPSPNPPAVKAETKPKFSSHDDNMDDNKPSNFGAKEKRDEPRAARKPSQPSSPVVERNTSPSKHSTPSKFNKSPAVPTKSTAARNFTTSKAASSSQATDSDARQTIQDFFGNLPESSKTRPDVDAAAILQTTSGTPDKIRTLRKQIWELTSDGKRLPMANQQEYMLFEDSMYICAHVFGTQAGKHVTDAYLWVGDGVSPSAVEDAQLFARNAAKEVGAAGRLTVLHQGKESSNFFEALGGIIIVRRGSSKDAGAKYMLCGRKHLGQMAFDEVEYGSKSLCSGFPFIVAAPGGTLYLWKGKGSGADELGCARLIAMDLGLTGDIQEIDDGEEPTAFWKTLQSSEVEDARIGGHWPLKAKKESFTTRLFVIDDARPRSAGLGALWGRRTSTTTGNDEPSTADVREITPFAQSDLSQDGIFVLDAYFEIYVILCWRSTARFAAFKSAMHFAQEYAILAASGEDRPFVPTAEVIFSGATSTYLKTAFRKWDDSRVTTQPIGSTSETSVLPLHAAITAIME